MTVKLNVGGVVKEYDTQMSQEEMGVHDVRSTQYWTACGLKGKSNSCEHVECALAAADYTARDSAFVNVFLESLMLGQWISWFGVFHGQEPGTGWIVGIAIVLAWNIWGNKVINIRPLGERPWSVIGWIVSAYLGIGFFIIWGWWRLRELIRRRRDKVWDDLIEFESKGTVSGLPAYQVFHHASNDKKKYATGA
jgi:hypothetical protein